MMFPVAVMVLVIWTSRPHRAVQRRFIHAFTTAA